MSSLPLLTCPQTNSNPLFQDLLTPSELETMSIGRRSRGLKPNLQYFNRGWTMKMMGLKNALQDTKKTGSASSISPSPWMMAQSSLPASSSSSTMEGSLGSTLEPRENRRLGLLNYMHPQITPQTSQWSPSPVGSITNFGATGLLTPSSRMPSMTLMTGASSLMSTTIINMTRSMPTLSRRWNFWKQTSKQCTSPGINVKNNSLLPALPIMSNIFQSMFFWGSSNQPGRGGP